MVLPVVLVLSGIALVSLRMGEAPASRTAGVRLQTIAPMTTPGPPQTLGTTVILPIADETGKLNSSERTPADDLATLDLLLSSYRRHHGGNPVGANEDVAAALLGKNPKGLVYMPRKGAFLSDRGQLVDRWGTPYFFHALAGDHMDIRSAGPDRVFWSKDDIVHRPGE